MNKLKNMMTQFDYNIIIFLYVQMSKNIFIIDLKLDCIIS